MKITMLITLQFLPTFCSPPPPPQAQIPSSAPCSYIFSIYSNLHSKKCPAVSQTALWQWFYFLCSR